MNKRYKIITIISIVLIILGVSAIVLINKPRKQINKVTLKNKEILYQK